MNKIVYKDTSHSIFKLTKRKINVRHLKTEIEAKSKITFLPKVCQLVRIHASPKQPQSATGLNSAKKSVKGVNTLIMMSAKEVAVILRTPKKRNIPIQNSMDDKTTANNKGTKEGINPPIPNACI